VGKRLIVTGTAAALVLTAGILGAVAVQPPEQERQTAAGASEPDALQGLPPMMLKHEPVSGPAENGTVDVHGKKPEPQNDPFKHAPAAKPESGSPMDPYVVKPTGRFAPQPGSGFEDDVRPASPSYPIDHPTQRPTDPPSPRPTPWPSPTLSPSPTPSPTPSPSPEPSDPPSEDPSTEPSPELSVSPSEESAAE
jgi:hypothetical protein